MKIVCDSCGAKYSIADEKVAGKVFKIRCKKCSEVIVVRGETNEFEDDESTRVFDYGGEAIWHVVIDGEQQGPFAPLQIEAYLTGGRIDGDAYVWKEGFDGWKALREVPELATLLASSSAGDPVDANDLFASTDDGDVFGSVPEAKPAPAEKPAADLFASSAKSSSPFEAASADDDGLVASAPSPRVSASQGSMTGQRNENSVLFSLSNLQALATGGPAAPAAKPAPSAAASPFSAPAPVASAPVAAKPAAGHAAGEASGLIDIRALASAANTVNTPKAASGGSVDDLLSLGGGSPLTSGLGAPMLAPAAKEEPEKKSNTGVIVGVTVGALALAASVAALFVVLNREPETRIVERVVVQGGGEAAAPAAGTAGAGAVAAANPATPTPAPAAGTEPSRATTGTTGSTHATRDRSSTTTMSTAAPAPSAMAAATAPVAAAPASSAMSSANLDLDQLLNMAAMTETTMAASADSALPETPSRDSVGSALRGVSGAVRACGEGEHGSAPVAVTFGSSGAVTSANVSGPFAGTPVGACVAAAVRRAHVPPFRNATFNVTFPYSL